MSENSYGPVSITMGHLIQYCDLSKYAILMFVSHDVGDKFSVRLIYYTCSHHF